MENKRQAGAVVISPDRMRSVHGGIKKQFPGMLVSPSTLRIEVPVVNGKGKYDFPVTRDQNSDQITEIKLDRNDKFVVTHIGLMLMKRLSTKTGAEVLQTYPNIQEFADVSSTFAGADLEVFYNGHFQIKVGQKVFVEKLDSRRFRAIEDVQQSSSTTKSSARENSGLVELTPQVVLDGDAKNEITLQAPVHSSHLVAHTTASTTNYLVLFCRGFLITKQ
jgi:hypothetical protein